MSPHATHSSEAKLSERPLPAGGTAKGVAAGRVAGPGGVVQKGLAGLGGYVRGGLGGLNGGRGHQGLGADGLGGEEEAGEEEGEGWEGEEGEWGEEGEDEEGDGWEEGEEGDLASTDDPLLEILQMFGSALNNRGLKEKSGELGAEEGQYTSLAERVKAKISEVRDKGPALIAGRDAGTSTSTRVGMAVGGVGMLVGKMVERAREAGEEHRRAVEEAWAN